MSMRYSTQEIASLKNLQYEGVKKILLADHDANSRQFNVSLLQKMGGAYNRYKLINHCLLRGLDVLNE